MKEDVKHSQPQPANQPADQPTNQTASSQPTKTGQTNKRLQLYDLCQKAGAWTGK